MITPIAADKNSVALGGQIQRVRIVSVHDDLVEFLTDVQPVGDGEPVG